MNPLLKIATCTLLLPFALALTGCGVATSNTTQATQSPNTSHAISGKVHGGQNPVSNSTIQLYAVGITGPRSAATPLISAVIQTDAYGFFNITGDWNCTSNTATYGTNPLLYIVSSGGNPGISPTTNNTALMLIAALGPCTGLTSSTNIIIDEVTTVAAVAALTPFMGDALHIGAQGANPTGLVNAFATANTLANVATGMSPGSTVPANVAVPSNTIYALANILSACVNSSGPTAPNCSALFSAATTPSGSVPVDTVTAMLNVNTYPANNTTPLMRVMPTFPPFPTTIASAPNDWTLALKFTGGGLNAPTGIAIDPTGNAWVANAAGNSVTGLSSSGALLTGTNGYTGSNNILGAQAIAVDKSGNLWLADTLLSSVVQLTVSNGSIQSNTSYTSGGLNGPTGIAIDSQSNIWVANFAGASLTELNSTGTPVGASPITANGTLQAPSGIAIDASGNVWVTDNAASTVAEFNQSQALLSNTGYTDSAIFAPTSIAIDASGRAWIADNGTNTTSLLSSTGAALLTTPITGGGLAMPAALAIDGAGTVWVANSQTTGSLSELAYGQAAPLSPATGLGLLNTPSAIAIDASGNIWTANSGDNSVAEFIGIAAPTLTPLAANVGP